MSVAKSEVLIFNSQLLAERDYWKEKLSNVTAASSLRPDYDSSATSLRDKSVVELQFPESVTNKLNELTSGSSFLTYTAILTAAKICLYKYSGGKTIVVGSPALKELGRANSLAIASDIDADMTFRQLLQNSRETLLEAYQHQSYPFEYLMRDLGIGNGNGHGSFFDLTIGAKDLHGEFAELDHGVTLTIENNGNLAGLIEFSPTAYARETIDLFGNHLVSVLEEGLNDKDKSLTQFEMLTRRERQQLLVEWNQTQTPYPTECIHKLVEAQVERSPEAVALRTSEAELFYEELNKRANQLAHFLRAQSVGPEVLVGICMDRSLEMVISLLAVLKAGGAYVPLDPEYPLERLRYMIEEINAWIVLTQGHLAERLPAHWGQMVCIDEQQETFASFPDTNPETSVGPDSPAYVIYTSGSTGQPKGVVVTHKGMGNLAKTVMIPAYNLTPSSRVLQFASFSFDASVYEVFITLLAGATLYLAPRESLLPGPDLIRLLRKAEITKVTLPPSVLIALPDDDLPDLRTLVVAGEACPLEVVQRWARGRTFINAYGPSEVTVCATLGQCLDFNRKPSIGRAISNTEVFILDRQLRPVPIGVAGELFVGGVGLARGYWGRADLTAAKFIPHPFSTVPGARMYATGDLARYRSDGQIDFLGRLDHQVKVRGFRIELGEIESVLKQHSAIQDAVVIVSEDRADDKRIVAYVVPKQIAPTVNELIDYLKLRLPEFMLPQAFVTLEQMPISLNGKIDRRRLPAPDQGRPDLKEAFVEPSGETERTLARIWSEVLRVEPIGAHDNFFMLGGESILALQVVARANQAGLRLQPKQIFDYQTIAELALVAGTAPEIEAEQGEVTGPVPLTPVQHWFFEKDPIEPHHYNQSVMLEAQQSLDLTALKRATEALLSHHDALRLRFSRAEETWVQFNAEVEESVPVEHFDLCALPDEQLSETIEQKAAALQASLNLSEGPLLRVALFDCGSERPDRLLILAHHLVVDGVSWRIILDDLQPAYDQALRGTSIDLGTKTTSFKYWAERLVDYAQSDKLDAEKSYWLQIASHDSPPLPVDYEVESAAVESAERVLISLTTAETKSLLQEVPAAYNTQINDVLLTAVVQAFSEWTGERSLLINLEGHGREEIVEDVELSRTVGWFTTEYPVFLSLDDARTEGDSLCLVKEQLRGVPQRGIGYGLLRYLSADAEVRDQLCGIKQPEVSFNYLGQFDQVLAESSLFRAARESKGQTQSPLAKLPNQLQINGSVMGGVLQLALTYSRDVFKRETIERFGSGVQQALRALIAHCIAPEAGRFTPSDFPLAHLSRAELDRVAGRDKRIEDIYPLTPFQQGLLFHTLYAPASGVYFTQLSGTLEGQQLDAANFHRAWQHVLDRHPILRTGFVWEGVTDALQVVRRDVTLPWQQFDWRDLSEAEQKEQLHTFLKEDQRRGFVLSEAPLMRCTLIQLADDTYRFVWSLHHLLLDGWALMQVVKEVFAFYDAFAGGKELSLAVGRPFRDYIAWLQDQDQSKAEAFWRKALAGFTAPTPIVVDRAEIDRNAVEDYYDQRWKLSVETTAALKDLARRHNLTLNTIVQGMFGVLLSRYSGGDDVVFGTTVAGRPATLLGVESILGLFINTLPVRVRIANDIKLIPWLKELQEHQIEAQEFEYTPLVQMQGWSDVPRGRSLFETILLFENYPVDASLKQKQEGLVLKDVSSIDHANYALAVGASPGSQLHFRFSYDRRVFEDETITRMFGHLRTLLEAAVANPEQCLADLPLLTGVEQQQVLTEWNETATPGLAQMCLHELFETQVRRFPEAMALRTPEADLSYAELNKRANQLAHFLRQQGVGPEVLVAICMDRSWEMVVSMLAVLKAGGAYVPLDPGYPLERLRFMMDEINAWVVLTQEQLAERLPAHWGQVVCVDDEWETFTSFSAENPVSNVTSDNLANLIFTSGSTGTPKAAMVMHGGLCNTILHRAEALSLTHEDRFLQTNSFSFDAAVWEFFAPLAAGAELVMLRPGGHQDPPYIVETLAQRRITVVEFPPSWLRMILQEPGLDHCVDLKHVICGGQILTGELQEKFYSRLNAQLHNYYGPSEASIDATGWTLQREVVTRTAPIGRPISNVQVYILDDLLRPLPIGVPGELHIGGDGLARGYLNQAGLTAEKFIPNPFSTKEGSRLYKTGDVARYLPNGVIEFCGRDDDQVKIRGFRIELGEVEAVLVQHEEVLETAVVAREDTPGDKRLVAYFVAAGYQPTIEQLRAYMKEKLPDHMVPSVFVMLEKLPRNFNGKVDRDLLPAPDLSRPQLETPFVAPCNSIEQILTEIWKEVLVVEQVGVDDNFFALGGDSIRSVQVLSLAQRRGLSFSLQSIFQHQTVRGLAEVLIVSEASEAPLQTSPFSLISVVDRERLPADVEDAYPLTMLQGGMIFHTEYHPDSAVYHSISSRRIKAQFDLQALQTAFERIVEQHPVMRTSVHLYGFSEPLQLVHSDVRVPVTEDDLRHLAPEEQDQVVADWLEVEKLRPFEWMRAPLIRLHVHRYTDDTFQFTFTAHHSVLDGWSDSIVFAELSRRYVSLVKGEEEAEARPPQLTFREFVFLEQQALEAEETRAFWHEKLSDCIISTVPRRPDEGARRRLRSVIPISSEVSDGLKQITQSTGIPIKNLLLAAHFKVMSFLTGHSDVLTGFVSNGRPETTDGERVAGLFLNTLPFRMKLTKGSWIDLARQTFEAENEMLPHRRYPLAQIQRDHAAQSLFETAFNFTQFHLYQELNNVSEVQVLHSISVAENNFALMLEFGVGVTSNQVQGVIHASSTETGEALLEQISGYYSRTIAAMAAAPDQKHQRFLPHSESELRYLIKELNDTATPFRANKCLHQLFEQQAAQTPHQVVLVHNNTRVTYAKLNSRANQIAHYLQSLGVGVEAIVGLCVNRSTEMVAALLGILKAGAAYLPLDPQYPWERVHFMLEDAGCRVLLTEQSLTERFAAGDLKLVLLDGDNSPIKNQPTSDLTTAVTSANAAYIIYTSGSTGQPKGVTIEHRSAVALVDWAIPVFSANELSGVLGATSICFDLSIFELFVPLACGGKVILAENGLELPQLSAASEVRLINTVPSAMAELVRLEAIPDSVCTVILAGELLPGVLAKRIYQKPTIERLVNLWGPTETTTYSSCTVVDRELTGQPSIGRPFPNEQIYILNADYDPLPAGVAGEVFVGGEKVARGYLNRPELTARRFIPDPFSEKPGSRMYRTGDLARYLPNGEIDFVGREDYQVKIRGFRVEPGEIEVVLAKHSSVRDVVVIAREDTPGDKRLVAYVVAKPETELTARDLRQYLLGKLPDYFVPQAFVFLQELPVTPNGKINRRALPAPEPASATRAEAAAGSRLPVEELVAGIWAEVLNLEHVQVSDNFFELGGHSLLGTQVVSRVREELRVEIPLRSLFETPTLAAFAAIVDAALRDSHGLSAPPIKPIPRDIEPPLSFAQQRLWIVEQLIKGSAVYHLPAAVRLKGRLDVDALERSLAELIRRHESLRTTFKLVNGEPVQVISPSLELRIPLVDLSQSPETEREAEARRLANEFMNTPFDLSNGPLLKAALLRINPEDHVALFVMHHIISDGWSMGVLVNEIVTLYEAFIENRPSPLVELPVQYADFAVWQRAWLQGDVLESQLEYWRRRLGPHPPELLLPLDRPRPPVQTHRGAHQTFSIAVEVHNALAALSRREGVTLFMTLLAAFQMLLYRYSSQEDIVVGTDMANRNRAETENVIGFFVNMLVLRTNLSGNPTFVELLGRVRETALEAYAHQDLPFETLVEELEPERDPSRNPLFQAVFVLQNTPSHELKLPGITLSPFPIASSSVQFDLIFSMSESRAGMIGVVAYNTDLFDATTISEMVNRFQTLLIVIAENPAQRIADMRLVTNDLTRADFPRAEISQKDFENLLAQLSTSA